MKKLLLSELLPAWANSDYIAQLCELDPAKAHSCLTHVRALERLMPLTTSWVNTDAPPVGIAVAYQRAIWRAWGNTNEPESVFWSQF